MCTRKPCRLVPALVAAAFLAAAPAVAAPPAPVAAPLSAPLSAEAPPAPGALQLLADWWTGLTEPVVALFASSGAEIEPDGGTVTATSSDDPTDEAESRHGVDPDG